jgi:hypothetical protein
MVMRRAGLWIILAALAAGGLAYGVFVYPDHRFRTELDQSFARLGPDVTGHYDTAHYSLISGQATVTGFALRGAKPVPWDAAAETIELKRPSLDLADAWNRATANPAALTPDIVLPVADNITVTGAKLDLPTSHVAWKSASIDGFRLYPAPLLHPGLPSFIEAQASALTRKAPFDFARLLSLARFEATVMLGIGYDHQVVDSLETTATASSQLPTGTITVSVGTSVSSKLERGVLQDASLSTVVEQLGPMGTATIDRVSMAGLDARKPLTALLDANRFDPAMLDGLKLGKMSIEGVRVKSPVGGDVTLGSFSVGDIALSHEIPVSGAIALGGLKLQRADLLDPQAMAVFEGLGVDTVTVGFDAAYAWDVANRHLAVKTLSLKIDELGAVGLSGDIVDFGPDSAMPAGALAHATLRYDDASLAERAFKSRATEEGVDPAALKEQLAATVKGLAAALGDSPSATAAVQAILAFIAAPHGLTIDVTPPKPIALTTLSTVAATPPAQLFDMLGITVTNR